MYQVTYKFVKKQASPIRTISIFINAKTETEARKIAEEKLTNEKLQWWKITTIKGLTQ